MVIVDEMATEQGTKDCGISDGNLNCKNFDGLPKEEEEEISDDLSHLKYEDALDTCV